jgi:hypothetical protein
LIEKELFADGSRAKIGSQAASEIVVLKLGCCNLTVKAM